MSDHGHAEALPAELPRYKANMGAVGGAAVLGLIGFGIAFATAGSMERAWQSYLLGVLYCFTISLGAMFMLLTFHAASARWVTGFRRVIETLSQGVWVGSVLMLPVLFVGYKSIYIWANPNKHYEAMEPGNINWFREWWLNGSNFTMRGLVVVVACSVAVFLLNSWSKAQDASNDPALHTKLVRLGSGGVPVLGLIATAGAFDWFMTLDPKWGSTIFGAYILAGGYLAALALTTFFTHKNREVALKGVAGIFEFHNLGKLLFALTCFWAYLGYAQYMLMWIANLPEEIAWWLPRRFGTWAPVFWYLVFGHFLLPFFALIRKPVKLNSAWMMGVAIVILFNHLVDITWLILPSESVNSTVQLSDIGAVLGAVGLNLSFILFRFGGVVVAPKGSPNFGAPVPVH